ncbi:hypothetical protein M0R45_005590 [Rubus argutus]|uniref:Uncharacterized protein n=1 Tax=Rubus argutus TaxID=59490 RepID=A0AAW1YN87_RUBAR
MDLEVKSDAGAGMLLCKQATSAFDLSPGGGAVADLEFKNRGANFYRVFFRPLSKPITLEELILKGMVEGGRSEDLRDREIGGFEGLELEEGIAAAGFGADQIDIEGDALNILNSLKLDVLYMDLSDIGGGIDEVRLVLPTFTMVSWKHVRKRDNRSSRPWTAGSALPLVQSMYVL